VRNCLAAVIIGQNPVFNRHLLASRNRTTIEQVPKKYRTTTEQMSLLVMVSYPEKSFTFLGLLLHALYGLLRMK
jgi:hypothetical protein